MNKIFLLVLSFASIIKVSAQDSTVINPQSDNVPQVVDTLPITDPNSLIEETKEENRKKNKVAMPVNLANRSKDHLLIQLGYNGWGGAPDTINTGGLPRTFNMYFLFDFPFKTNPHLSVAIGAGIGTDNMYFKDTYIDIIGEKNNRLTFTDVSDTTKFKKYKLLTSFLEAPIEFRYSAKPATPNKSFKVAIGAKIGTMLAASTKGKNLLNGKGQAINNYIEKQKSKKFFNTTRMAVTARVGYGAFSVFGTYQVNSFVKDGFGPDIRPYSIGLTVSGL